MKHVHVRVLCSREGSVCWMSLCLLCFSMSVILILSQSLRLFCDPGAAVLKSATYSHTATIPENFREATITPCPSLPPL